MTSPTCSASARNRKSRHRRSAWLEVLSSIAVGALVTVGCTPNSTARDSTSQDSTVQDDGAATIVVSNVVLGSVVAEIAGSAAEVVVLIPNGIDPHLYEPSAKDIEQLNNADLIVINGLGLESGIEDSLSGARDKRIPIFEATDHIAAHQAPASDVGAGDPVGHEHADDDPHFWTDPRLMAEVVEDVGDALVDLGLDIGDRASMFSERILTFDQDMLRRVETLPIDRRVLVTGHESLGYFAERYGFEIVGTIIPGLTSGAEVSAGNLADVKAAVARAGVDVIFTELGTSSASARVLSDELGVEVVEISTHLLPREALETEGAGDAYLAFIDTLVETIVTALAE